MFSSIPTVPLLSQTHLRSQAKMPPSSSSPLLAIHALLCSAKHLSTGSARAVLVMIETKNLRPVWSPHFRPERRPNAAPLTPVRFSCARTGVREHGAAGSFGGSLRTVTLVARTRGWDEVDAVDLFGQERSLHGGEVGSSCGCNTDMMVSGQNSIELQMFLVPKVVFGCQINALRFWERRCFLLLLRQTKHWLGLPNFNQIGDSPIMLHDLMAPDSVTEPTHPGFAGLHQVPTLPALRFDGPRPFQPRPFHAVVHLRCQGLG